MAMQRDLGARMELEQLKNTRDLGGYPSQHGGTIVFGRLIRSGALYDATAADLAVLEKCLNGGVIVDFRTGTERRQRPDPEIAGVIYLENDILTEEVVGITHEQKERDTLKSLLFHATQMGNDPDAYMEGLYRNLLSDRHAARGYGKFLDVLLENQNGAVLWHCSAGKDRVGIGTALLLSALEVPEELIIRDFGKSQMYLQDSICTIRECLRQRTDRPEVLEAVNVLYGVKESYLEEAFAVIKQQFGSVCNYIDQQIGFSIEQQKILRNKYLA